MTPEQQSAIAGAGRRIIGLCGVPVALGYVVSPVAVRIAVDAELAKVRRLQLRLLDVEAIALHYGVAQGTIRRWASEDQWTPHGTRRRRLWDLEQAQASYERRYGAPLAV